MRLLNQFEVMGSYRFHYEVTGNTVIELAKPLGNEGVGNGRVAAFVAAMGSAGTIAAGDRIKQVFPEHKIVGLEPVHWPTLFRNGYGAHQIQGIGDKHVSCNLARTFFEQGDLTTSFEPHQNALSYRRRVGDRPSQAWSLMGLARISEQQGEWEAARGITPKRWACSGRPPDKSRNGVHRSCGRAVRPT